MTPTKAQIEAAARALANARGYSEDWWDRSPMNREGFLFEAQAALTAAGEQEINALKEELELQRTSQISAVNQMLAAEQREVATIERCAQKVGSLRQSFENKYGDEVIGPLIDEIIAEIRALKEKP